jgi:hypothetical protein
VQSSNNKSSSTTGHPESFASQFERISGVGHWLAWLGMMLGVCAVIVLSYLFSWRIDWVMYGVIIILACIMIHQGFHDAKFLTRETRLASEQVKILEDVDDFETFFVRSEPSVFRSHIENLFTISWSHPDVSQDNLVEVLHSRLMARNRVIDLSSSVLITLGLIGTIVGLIMMMESLKATLAGGNMDGGGGALMSRLFGENSPLEGLGTAFITTLLGAVLGGIVLRVLSAVADANIMRYTAHLAELTEVHVLPTIRRLALERHNDRANDAAIFQRAESIP